MLTDEEYNEGFQAAYTGHLYTSYDLVFTAKKWYMDMVITQFQCPSEGRSCGGWTIHCQKLGISESNIMSRTIDGKSAVYALKTSDNGYEVNAVYWLDNEHDSSSEKVLIKIMTDDETRDGINRTLDTMRIERITDC